MKKKHYVLVEVAEGKDGTSLCLDKHLQGCEPCGPGHYASCSYRNAKPVITLEEFMLSHPKARRPTGDKVDEIYVVVPK